LISVTIPGACIPQKKAIKTVERIAIAIPCHSCPAEFAFHPLLKLK